MTSSCCYCIITWFTVSLSSLVIPYFNGPPKFPHSVKTHTHTHNSTLRSRRTFFLSPKSQLFHRDNPGIQQNPDEISQFLNFYYSLI
ncbi:hypothetical protein L6452_33626 [Arctium lappa]|uniref:Uncharacterized protein n=1 Tax=Arctium lappa TaxID=4217 RepID=A0ACB8YG45_ARCLA|nr:hypothetical protein L6452_33626 [Arctium lappa]